MSHYRLRRQHLIITMDHAGISCRQIIHIALKMISGKYQSCYKGNLVSILCTYLIIILYINSILFTYQKKKDTLLIVDVLQKC